MDALFRKLNKDLWAAAGEWVKPEKVDTIRASLLRLTRGGQSARIFTVSEGADCSPALVEFCYASGLLVGYQYKLGRKGGFRRKLQLIVDNTK